MRVNIEEGVEIWTGGHHHRIQSTIFRHQTGASSSWKYSEIPKLINANSHPAIQDKKNWTKFGEWVQLKVSEEARQTHFSFSFVFFGSINETGNDKLLWESRGDTHCRTMQ